MHRGDGYFDVYTDVIESHYGEVRSARFTLTLRCSGWPFCLGRHSRCLSVIF